VEFVVIDRVRRLHLIARECVVAIAISMSFALFVAKAPAQERSSTPDQPLTPNPYPGGPVTVRGVVRNGATGDPVPRALVHIEGDASTGTLTDGDGRFEIAGIQPGPQIFEITKPGFLDRSTERENAAEEDGSDSSHNVIVSPGMPELNFSIAPSCAIHGLVDLSTGDAPLNIGVVLLQRRVQDGRAAWQVISTAKTNMEGAYRFAGLPAGTYALFTNPAMDSDAASNEIAVGSAARVVRDGYPTVFYPDAREQSGAAKIHVSPGQQVQANLHLTLEVFHAVTARIANNHQDANTKDAGNYQAVVTDVQGHALSYPARYDSSTATVQALLPDGTYSLLVIEMRGFRKVFEQLGDSMRRVSPGNDEPQTGSVEFTVAGHAITNLRLPMSQPRVSPVQFAVMHAAGEAAQPQGQTGATVAVTASQAGGLFADGTSSAFASGDSAGPLDTSYVPPGQYWVHTRLPQHTLCESSFTAAGVNLAREPLTVGLAGAPAPLELAVRDDCAKLTLTLPVELSGLTAGEERFYTIYVVPDFDTTTDVEPLTMRPTSGRSITISGLTPGSYHVYAFEGSASFEYRNPDAVARLKNAGQAIDLSPGASASLAVEAPAH